ncbi:MAG: hypothetical protein RR301_08120 [Clostridia bacterium]
MVKWTKAIAVILFVAMLIGSLILGNMFQIVTPDRYSSYADPMYTYNVGIAVGGVAVSVLVFTVLLCLAGILQRLDAIRDRLPKSNKD